MTSETDPSEIEKDDANSVFYLLRKKKWDVALREAKRYPKFARDLFMVVGFYEGKINSRVNALHVAAAEGAPSEIITSLVSIHPGGLSQRDSYYSRIPLHVAVLSGSIDTVICFLKLDPKTAEHRDDNGRVALHYACKELNGGETLTRLLIRAYPDGATVADEGGFLPLHVACRYSASLSIIRMLIRAAPESLSTRTKKGSTPLSCAHGNKSGIGPDIVGILERCAEESSERFADIQKRMSDRVDQHAIKEKALDIGTVSNRF